LSGKKEQFNGVKRVRRYRLAGRRSWLAAINYGTVIFEVPRQGKRRKPLLGTNLHGRKDKRQEKNLRGGKPWRRVSCAWFRKSDRSGFGRKFANRT